MPNSLGQNALASPVLPAAAAPDARLRRSLWHGLLAAVLYFAAAYAALLMKTGVAGVAIFWPASGVSVGLMIVLGATAYLPVAAGTMVATVAANLLFDRTLALSIPFALLNAGEALAVAWLMARDPERDRSLSRLTDVLGFFAIAAASTGLAAAAATCVLQLAAPSEAWLEIWRVWFLSDFIGIAVLAPLIIAAADLARARARHHDWGMDVALLLMLTVTLWYGITTRLDSNSWLALVPGAPVLPLLLWISARSQPIVPAIVVVLAALIMTLAAVTGQGRFGAADIAAETRVLAAQVSLVLVSLLTLLTSALFQERRSADARIKAGDRLLAITADAAPGVIFSLRREADGRLRFAFISAKSREVLGLEPEALAASAEPLLSRLDAPYREALVRALDQPDGQQEPIRLELACSRLPDQTIWLEISAAPIAEPDGATAWHGFLQNVTARRVLLQEIDHRTRNLLTVVQSVAQHTASSSGQDEFADVLDERLAGLAASHELLAASQWQSVEIGRLARSQLGHLACLPEARLMLSGPQLLLKPAAAQVLGMAIHELATNALKYGGLSNATGAVRLTWGTAVGGAGEVFRMAWEERGGPPVAPSGRHGFGRTVTIDMVAYQLGAKAEIKERPEGIVWRVEAPAEGVLYKQDLAA